VNVVEDDDGPRLVEHSQVATEEDWLDACQWLVNIKPELQVDPPASQRDQRPWLGGKPVMSTMPSLPYAENIVDMFAAAETSILPKGRLAKAPREVVRRCV
jgi:hypothetical protein